MRLYYLAPSHHAKPNAPSPPPAPPATPDNHLLSRAFICDQLAKTTIGFGKFQGWRVLGDGPPCLDVSNNARLQEVNVAQQKLIGVLNDNRSQTLTVSVLSRAIQALLCLTGSRHTIPCHRSYKKRPC